MTKIGVNVKGDRNVENVTEYETTQDHMEDDLGGKDI
jgi:hypothetical protein